ncbi:hypothetical protein RFI_11470 [Reticulomyxa filosa]|uniref:Uncharacterized protein n=1 Tax=Reticulomyxa filosa TaxID=46433 RepID=X6NH74_RETFI|nr:hypothetical protein RFI_11470 [Reticulomyxa filosa]|eukprot:ETO25670.1 hypothetical protein RFI_11470 [Reticulomyxa filosa]
MYNKFHIFFGLTLLLLQQTKLNFLNIISFSRFFSSLQRTKSLELHINHCKKKIVKNKHKKKAVLTHRRLELMDAILVLDDIVTKMWQCDDLKEMTKICKQLFASRYIQVKQSMLYYAGHERETFAIKLLIKEKMGQHSAFDFAYKCRSDRNKESNIANCDHFDDIGEHVVDFIGTIICTFRIHISFVTNLKKM